MTDGETSSNQNDTNPENQNTGAEIPPHQIPLPDDSGDFDDFYLEDEPNTQPQYNNFETWLSSFSFDTEDWSLTDFF